ncbi:MAG: hypothetical protein FGM54_07890 [Chitinophagaceae bacterium]|nr:hypothetical protein [Chitinophagaceae bacterium]
MKASGMVGLLLVGITAYSFILPDNKKQLEAQRSKYVSYLGCEATDVQAIPTQQFLRLIQKPLCVKDSAGRLCKVQQFELSYAERGLYQDSTGLPMVVTEYSGTNCKGDTIPKSWQLIFGERGYKGDTIIIDNVIATAPDNKPRLCKGLRIVLR